jgi:hypothetical protein
MYIYIVTCQEQGKNRDGRRVGSRDSFGAGGNREIDREQPRRKAIGRCHACEDQNTRDEAGTGCRRWTQR